MNLSSLHGNWVDLVILLILCIYILEGWGRGMVLGIAGFGGFLLSFITSLKFYNAVGKILVSNFALSTGIANAAGFLLVGFTAEVIFSLVISITARKLYPVISRYLKQRKLLSLISASNQIFGIIPSIGEALVLSAFILTLLITLPIKGQIKKDIVTSRIGGFLIIKTQGVENTIKTIFGQAVNETLTFLTVNPSPTSDEKVDLKFTQNEGKIDEAGEQTMLNLVNQERTSRGLRHLSLSFELRDLARNYARDMFERGYFSHYNPEGLSPFNRMNDRGIIFMSAGENLALAPNVSLAHQGLMNSPGHRANILSSDFGKIGIGVIDGGIYGEMFVQEFTN